MTTGRPYVRPGADARAAPEILPKDFCAADYPFALTIPQTGFYISFRTALLEEAGDFCTSEHRFLGLPRVVSLVSIGNQF
jgi:hypothetical protein